MTQTTQGNAPGEGIDVSQLPAAPPEKPGLLQRIKRAAQRRRSSLDQAGKVEAPDQQERGAIPPGVHATVADGAKSAFTVLVGGLAPFLIALILTISAGYYFNALQPFTFDVRSLVAYGTAAIVEAVNLALFFVSSKAFWSGKRSHFTTALVIGLALTIISVIAQVLYLSNNLDQASIGKGAQLLQGVPLVGALASTALIIVTRALALHVAEFACCYVVARSAVSHRKIIQAQQEQQEAELALMESAQYAQFKRALHNAQMAQLARVQQMLLADHPAGSEGGALSPFRISEQPPTNGNGKH